MIRHLQPAEWRSAFPVIAELRDLDEEEFLRRVERQSYSGYQLVGAFEDGKLVGVMGMRPVHTLARGAHLHIDDLIVTHSCRHSGTGRALIAFADAEARARKMTAIFLDAQQAAIPFYERLDFIFHPAPSMKRLLK
jgi:GNAT superfamily N-acetyltransferase